MKDEMVKRSRPSWTPDSDEWTASYEPAMHWGWEVSYHTGYLKEFGPWRPTLKGAQKAAARGVARRERARLRRVEKRKLVAGINPPPPKPPRPPRGPAGGSNV